jgi:hypothetical protein
MIPRVTYQSLSTAVAGPAPSQVTIPPPPEGRRQLRDRGVQYRQVIDCGAAPPDDPGGGIPASDLPVSTQE